MPPGRSHHRLHCDLPDGNVLLMVVISEHGPVRPCHGIEMVACGVVYEIGLYMKGGSYALLNQPQYIQQCVEWGSDCVVETM